MNKIIALLFMLIIITNINAQSYQISFEASGASTILDSVLVENLTQGSNLKLLGNDTLLLTGGTTSLNEIDINNTDQIIYPNPILNDAFISFNARTTGMMKFNIYDMSGKVVLKHSEVLSQGYIKYKIKGLNQGLYFISICGENYLYHSRIISINQNSSTPEIEKINENITNAHIPIPLKLMVNMPYTVGDVMRYTGYSVDLVATVTDIPTSSKTVTFIFVALLPSVTTNAISAITNSSATSGGNVTFDGGSPVTDRGVCFSTATNPTTSNSIIPSGNGTGTFISNLSGLISNTTYYARAYAINSVGTAYGDEETFTTDKTFVCGDSVNFWYNGALVKYGTVISHNNTCWLDRNLGANSVATSSNDGNGYGDLFQWGRLDDGHQIRNSTTTTTISNSNMPGHSLFIVPPDNVTWPSQNWLNTQNNSLWQGVSGINNPCPTGWRIPTETEFLSEIQSWPGSNLNGAFNGPLKLTTALQRQANSTISGNGAGFYWSSTISTTYSYYVRYMYFDHSNATTFHNPRASGHSVRCIKD